MLALITGASGGLGQAFAQKLDEMGYSTVLVGRNEKKLCELKEKLKNPSETVVMDLASSRNVKELFERFPQIDVLVNNAGFGQFGAITESDVVKDEEMIDLNVKAAYLLQKLYLKELINKKGGIIINVASSAAFMAGPYFALYYATKSFLLRASQAASREAKGTGVTVSAFCPGSVDTGFNLVAGTTSSTKPITAEKAAEYAIKKAFKGKAIIIPTFKMKAAFVMSKLMPEPWLTEFSCHIQRKRMK